MFRIHQDCPARPSDSVLASSGFLIGVFKGFFQYVVSHQGGQSNQGFPDRVNPLIDRVALGQERSDLSVHLSDYRLDILRAVW
jgi:hypothetical protein